MPATETELRKAKQKRKEVREELVTPPSKVTKVKKSDSAETLSGPKLNRTIQSHPILEAKPCDERKVPATAVKAKSAPKQPLAIPKPEQTQQDATRAQAVQDCLRRPSTGDLSVPKSSPKDPTEPKDPKKKKNTGEASGADPPTPPEDPPGDDGDGDDSDSEDSNDRKAREVRAKRMAHARYMRFSRSLTSS